MMKFVLCVCVAVLLLSAEICMGGYTMQQNNITTTFSDNIILVENLMKLQYPVVDVNIMKNDTNISVLLDRVTGYTVEVEIFDLNFNPVFVVRNRTSLNDNMYYNSAAHPNILEKYCNYPIPSSYTIQKDKKKVQSEVVEIQCTSIAEYEDRSLGCPMSRGRFARNSSLNCCCNDSCTPPIYPLPPKSSNTVLCINQNSPADLCNASSICDSIYANWLHCLNVTSVDNVAKVCKPSKDAYDACVANACPICHLDTCSDGDVNIFTLIPNFPTSYDLCDIEYSPPEYVFAVKYSLFYNGSLLAQKTGESGKQASVSFFSSGNEVYSNFLIVAHNILLENPLEQNYLLTINNDGSYCASQYERNSVDIVNTDVWWQYSYTTPLAAYIPSGLDVDFSGLLSWQTVTDPYGYFYQKYLQYQNISSIFYWNWEPLLNKTDSVTKDNFLRYGFSYDCNLVEPSFIPFVVDTGCITNLFWLSDYTYEIPLALDNKTFTIEFTFVPGGSIFGMIADAGTVDIDYINTEIDLVVINSTTPSNTTAPNNNTPPNNTTTPNNSTNKNSTLSSRARGIYANSTTTTTNNTTTNNTTTNTTITNSTNTGNTNMTTGNATVTIQNNFFHISFFTRLQDCVTQYISIGVAINNVIESNYAILINGSTCPLEITVNFLVPVQSNMDSSSDYENGDTTNIAIVIQDAGQPYYIYPKFGYVPTEYSFGFPTNPLNFQLSLAQQDQIKAAVGGLAAMAALCAIFLIYFYEVRDRKRWHKPTWRSDPIKKLCFDVQDLLPTFGNGKDAKGGYFASQQHLIAVALMALLGIVKAITFSMTVLWLVYLWINTQNFNTLSQFPGFYEESLADITNISTTIRVFGENELLRQQQDAISQMDACDTIQTYLKLNVTAQKAVITNMTNEYMNNCSIDDMKVYFTELQVKTANDAYNSEIADLNKYYAKVQDDYDTARKWASFAVDVYDVVCNIPLIDLLCPDLPDPPMPTSLPEPKPYPSLPDQSVIPELTVVTAIGPAPTKTTSDTTFYNPWQPPNINIPIPTINIDFNFALNIAISMRDVLFALDIVLMIRRILRALQGAALMLLGTDVEKEIKIKLHTKDFQSVNLLPKEYKKQRRAAAAANSFARVVLTITDTAQLVIDAVKSFPILGFVIQNIFLLAFVITILVMAVFVIYIILAPGVLESIGVMDIIVQPLRIQLATTNTVIVQQAYFLNAVVLRALQKKSEATVLGVQVDVALFNADQINTIIQYNIEYTNLKEAMLESLLGDQPYPFCDPFNMTLVEMDYSLYDCQWSTIEARPYVEFNSDQFELALSAVFDVYITAFRDTTLVTLYCIAGFIGFFIFSELITTGLLALLRMFNAIKINRKRWYVEIEQTNFDEENDDSYNHKKEVKKMLKRCGTAYGDELSMRFIRVIDEINELKADFRDITVPQFRGVLERENSDAYVVRQRALNTESSIEKLRNHIFRRIKGKTTIPSAGGRGSARFAPTESASNIELMTRDEPKTTTVNFRDVANGDAGHGDADNGDANNTQPNGEKSIEDKLHQLKMVALQAEELFQWTTNKFPNIIDPATLQDNLLMVQRLPYDTAVCKNLMLLEGMVLHLLDRFRSRSLPTTKEPGMHFTASQ